MSYLVLIVTYHTLKFKAKLKLLNIDIQQSLTQFANE